MLKFYFIAGFGYSVSRQLECPGFPHFFVRLLAKSLVLKT